MILKDSMSEKQTPQYIPLYRKYRPKTLQEVVGQEHIKKALANAINLNKISHAYLFTGPRGTGKTSTARIMAKSLNCKEGPTLTPCGVCPSCQDIMNSVPIDVIEIDAASNRSVEDAQNIIEKIQYIPVNGKFKIYIIDEVHMLTNHAFNALLKTLEEPPENVIFILATTEPQKVLETITSRCQRYDFRRITTLDIINHLKYISEEEKIKIEDDALATIAKNAAGGMRDSLALLDQVSVLDGAKKITTDDVNSLLGRLSFGVLNTLSEKIIQSRAQDAIEDLEKIYNSGNEPTQILTNLLAYLKNLLIVKNCQEMSILLELTQLNEAQLQTLKKQSEDVDTHQIIFLIEKIAYYIKELKATNNQHLWLEIAMIDLANLAQNTSLLELQARIARLESGAPVQTVPQTYTTQPAPIAKAPIKPTVAERVEAPVAVEPVVEKVVAEKKELSKVEEIIVEEIKAEADEVEEVKPKVKADVKAEAKTAVKEEKAVTPDEFSPMPKSQHVESTPNNVIQSWHNFLSVMNKNSPSTCAMLSQHSKPVEISAENIVIACEKEFSLKALNTESKKKFIATAAEEVFGVKDVNITIRMVLPTDQIPAGVKEEKKNLTLEKKSQPMVTKEDEDDLEEVIQEMKPKAAVSSKKKEIQNMPSDQVTMVMNLFDGKYID